MPSLQMLIVPQGLLAQSSMLSSQNCPVNPERKEEKKRDLDLIGHSGCEYLTMHMNNVARGSRWFKRIGSHQSTYSRTQWIDESLDI